MQLAVTLSEETEDHVLAATSWSLGQIGRHTPEHAKAVAATNALPKLLELYLKSNSSEDLQMKVHTYICMDMLYHLLEGYAGIIYFAWYEDGRAKGIQ